MNFDFNRAQSLNSIKQYHEKSLTQTLQLQKSHILPQMISLALFSCFQQQYITTQSDNLHKLDFECVNIPFQKFVQLLCRGFQLMKYINIANTQ